MTSLCFQEDISNFMFKLPAIMYNSPLNEARGLPDNEQQNQTPVHLVDDVVELDEMDILMSDSAKLISTIKWTSKEELLSWICSTIRCTADDGTLE